MSNERKDSWVPPSAEKLGRIAKLAQRIGKTVRVPTGLGSIEISLEVIDHRRDYGRDRWLVRPTDGSDGEAWVELPEPGEATARK